MENNKLPILKITNIKWHNTAQNKKKLPTEIEVQWGSKKWSSDQVSKWLSDYYGVNIINLEIEQLKEPKTSSG